MNQNLIYSSRSSNKTTVDLDQVNTITKYYDVTHSGKKYSITFYLPEGERAFWYYESKELRDADYDQLLTIYCKDIIQ